MTRYKEYIRDCGNCLECDYEILPWKFANCELLGVQTMVLPDGILMVEQYNIGDIATKYTRDGKECVEF